MSRTTVRGPRTRAIIVACIALLVVIGAAFAWIGVRAFLAKNELEALLPVARDLQEAVGARDLDRLGALAAELGTHSANAAALTGDPLWAVASVMPVLGADFDAVRTVSSSLDAISRAGVPLIELAQRVGDPDSPAAGLDIGLVQSAGPPLAAAAKAFAQADHDLSAIRASQLLPPLASGVTTLADVVATASPLVTSVARTAEVLPSLLGADEPRTVLITMQNPAEPRTGGGITGSFALLSAVDGDITLVDQADSGAFPSPPSPIPPIPASTVELYGDVIGRFVINASMTADFALTGQLASAWWQTRTGTAPDAVVSLDPEVLAALLSVSGPVSLPDGTQLGADNLVQMLLVDAYFDLDRDQQTVLQQAVTGAVVSQILTGPIDPIAWIEALRPAIEQGRISVWSSREDEQALLASGPFAGPAARHAAAGDDAFAVYVNDRTGGKMGIFLQTAIGADAVECRPDGRRVVDVRVTLENTAPPEAASFPWWVSGAGLEGVPPGEIGANVTVAAPPGSFFGGVTQDGALIRSINVQDVGFPSSLGAVTIPPGGSTTLDFRFISGEPGARSPVVVAPPLMHEAGVADTFSARCTP